MTQDPNPIFLADGDDPEMNRAFERARSTFRYFWRELSWEYRRIVSGLNVASVKVAFWDGDSPTPPPAPDDGSLSVEHMWLGDVAFDGRTVYGTLLNQPSWLKSVQSGDGVEVPFERVEDWMYARNGRVYGGYTVNLMRSRMGEGERRAHDEAWGLDFGDPETIELVPDWNAKPKKGFISRMLGGGKKADAAPPADPDAEHPMSENMADKLAETIASHPSILTDPDSHGLTMLHQLALAGSEAGVRVLVAKGADRDAQTPDGRTARDLAEAMGWPRVVAILS